VFGDSMGLVRGFLSKWKMGVYCVVLLGRNVLSCAYSDLRDSRNGK
jgi:hypothetical protein